MKKIKIGMKVGAERWGMTHAHPDAWMKPWKGTVISIDDPRAWHGTLAMGYGKATKQKVKEHLTHLEQSGISLKDEVPVLWEFGEVYWEPKHKIRPYTEDISKWKKLREERLKLKLVRIK